MPPQLGRPSSQSAAVSPGWASRLFFSAALIVGVLPALTIVPLTAFSQDPVLLIIYLLFYVLAHLFRPFLGMIGLLLVKSASWTRRLCGLGIFFAACLDFSILTHMVTMFVDQLPGEARGSIVIINAITAVIEVIFVALVFVSWNVVRKRGWLVCLASVLYAAAVVGVGQLADMFFRWIDIHSEFSDALTSLLDLVLIGLGFGLFHLLGRIRGATLQSTNRRGGIQQEAREQFGWDQQVNANQVQPSHWNHDPNYPGNPRR